MKGKILGKLGKIAPLAIVLTMLMAPYAMAANNSTGIDTGEGTVLAISVFFFLIGGAIIFWILPQSKEKKLTPVFIGIGIAIAIMAVLFYFTEYLTGYNITFWDEWIDYTEYTTQVSIAVAGSFLILLMTIYGVYNEKNPKKERNIILLGAMAMLIWFIIVALPALTFL